MTRIIGTQRPASSEEVRREADRIARLTRSSQASQPHIETTIEVGSPGAVAFELQGRGFGVQQLDGDRVRISKEARRRFHG